MSDDKTWIMIPARGGSRGLPRKNVRLLAGIPLIGHVVRASVAAIPAERCVVITDDDEIAEIASGYGVQVFREDPTTGKATLDDVAAKIVPFLQSLGASADDIFLTVQPTCPFVMPERIAEAEALFAQGAGSVISVIDDRHLGWRVLDDGTPKPDYSARVNRQMLPKQYRETGAVIGCRIRDLLVKGTRIVEPIRLLEVSRKEALDIDTFSDWAVAQYYVERREIVIRADASKVLGMGHVFRALAVAQELAQHRVRIVTQRAEAIAFELLSQSPFDVQEVDGTKGFLALLDEAPPDLVVLDQLDTTRAYIRDIKARCGKVVTFEDLGEGAEEADLVISDLYQNLRIAPERQLTGITNAILAPNFETLSEVAPFNETVGNILVLFGGTDPSHLTEKTLAALADVDYNGRVTVVLGPGFKRDLKIDGFGMKIEIHRNLKFMPGVLRSADLAISSAGRTVTELVSCGVPVMVMCQNNKELTHTHASARYGVINIGLGSLVDPTTIAAHITQLIDTPELRRTLRDRGLYETADRSNRAVIERMMEGLSL